MLPGTLLRCCLQGVDTSAEALLYECAGLVVATASAAVAAPSAKTTTSAAAVAAPNEQLNGAGVTDADPAHRAVSQVSTLSSRPGAPNKLW